MLVALTALTLVYIAIVVIGHLLLAIALWTYLHDDDGDGRPRPADTMPDDILLPLPVS